MKDRISVAIFTSNLTGGAGKTALDIHKALLEQSIDSKLISRKLKSSSEEVYCPNCILVPPDIGLSYDEIQTKSECVPECTLFTFNEPKLKRSTLTNLVKDVQIINLHWIAGFLTVEDIGFLSNLGKPVILTIHDMNLLTGGCHCFHGCEKWKRNCMNCPQLLDDKEHYANKVLKTKKKYWNTDNIHVVALSSHTKEIIKQSALLSKCEVTVIGNPIDLDVYKPIKQKEDKSKKVKNRDSVKSILFLPSYPSEIKGFKEMKESMSILAKKYPKLKIQIIVAGGGSHLIQDSDYPYPIVRLGVIKDPNHMAAIYSKADVTAVPSLEETFSNTAAESIACGTPIVGFNTGAIKDITGDGERGEVVEVGNVEQYAEAIATSLKKEYSAENFRIYAETNLSYEKQGIKYKKLFKSILKNFKDKPPTITNNVPDFSPALIPGLVHWYSLALKRTQEDAHNLKNIINSNKNIAQLSWPELLWKDFRKEPMKTIVRGGSFFIKKLYSIIKNKLKLNKRES
jgi:glycosyltransferase involved in cell wall biosynthesis